MQLYGSRTHFVAENNSAKIHHIRFYGNCLDRVVDRQPDLLTSRYRRRELRLSSMPINLPASDLERSKDVVHLMGASKAALRCRSQGATVG
jgi:hypothetical protein